MLFSDSAHVEDGIAHSSQSSVDADLSALGNLLKAHVLVIPHEQHLALRFGQGLDESPNVTVDLLCHQRVFDRLFAEFFAVKDIVLGVVGRLQVDCP